MASLWERALTLLFPHKCFLCGRVLAGEGWLCRGVRSARDGGGGLPGCGKRLDRCVCEASGPVCDGVSAALWYEGGVRRGIHRYKYSGRSYYAPFLAALMAKRVRGDFGDGAFDLVTWVPLHRKKLRRRGFCQTELLARELSRRLGAPAKAGSWPIRERAARRRGRRAPPHGSTTRGRRSPSAGRGAQGGAGAARGRRAHDGRDGRRCAELLKKVGAGEVRLTVAATTPPGQRKMAANGGRR